MSTKPVLYLVAGPIASGKTTLSKVLSLPKPYIDRDAIKDAIGCSDEEADAKVKEAIDYHLSHHLSFSLESRMATEADLKVVSKAKSLDYIVQCVYVLTADYRFNLIRLKCFDRTTDYHEVEDALLMFPKLYELCDIVSVVDNSYTPERVFKKRKEVAKPTYSISWDMDILEFVRTGRIPVEVRTRMKVSVKSICVEKARGRRFPSAPMLKENHYIISKLG